MTHVLFLPRQTHRVALVEVYNTMDQYCYKDLAKLADVAYFTWDARLEDLHPEKELNLHTAKHINYRPDPDRFTALVAKAVAHVRDRSSSSRDAGEL